MNFLTNVTGPPLATGKPIRFGSYSLIVTAKGFVVGDPLAFNEPGLAGEIAALTTGSGYINGHLHLHSRQFPMYYPETKPRLLLISPHLVVMPLNQVPAAMREALKHELRGFPDLESPDPEILRNVMPCFEIFQDSGRMAAV